MGTWDSDLVLSDRQQDPESALVGLGRSSAAVSGSLHVSGTLSIDSGSTLTDNTVTTVRRPTPSGPPSGPEVGPSTLSSPN